MTAKKRDNSIPFPGEDLPAIACSIIAHSRFVFFHEDDMNDAIQELCLVGLECAKKAKEGKGVRSYQYASMRGALINFVRKQNLFNRRLVKILDDVVDGEESGEGSALVDMIPTPKVRRPMEEYFLKDACKTALSRLPKRDRYCVEQCFIKGRTMTAVSRNLHITKEWTRHILDKAMASLQKSLAAYQGYIFE